MGCPTRPMQGWSGTRVYLILKQLKDWGKDTWFTRLLAPTTPAHFSPQLREELGCRIAHPKLNDMFKCGNGLSDLLDTCSAHKPAPEKIWSFAADAKKWGDHLLSIDSEYNLINYEHYLCCHAWELLQKFGSIGAFSSIVCEALNAVWKDTELHHAPRSGLTSESTYNLVSATTNPARGL